MSLSPPTRHPVLALLGLPLRVTLVAMALLELVSVWFFHLLIRPRYRIEGRCRSNAVCCHHLLFVEGPMLRWPPLRWLSSLWLQQVHAFYPTDNGVEMPDGVWARIYRCAHLDDLGRCRQHALRPMICRRYPRPGFFVPPLLHGGCGYRVVDRVTGQVVSPPPAPQTGEIAASPKDVSTQALVRRFGGRR